VRTLLDPVVVVGLKAAVTPVGSPVALKVTVLANPPVRGIEIVLIPLAPRFTVKLVGDADTAKSGGGGAFTVSIKFAFCVRPPPVPVMITLTRPVAAVLDAVRVKVLLVPVANAGLNVAVTPLGRLLALKLTPAENPPLRVIVIVLIPLAPRLIV